MSVSQIINIILALVLPLVSVQVIRWVFGKAITAVTGEVIKAGHVIKVVIGLGISFLMQVAISANLIPGLDPVTGSTIGEALLALASKAVYDLLHDLRK